MTWLVVVVGLGLLVFLHELGHFTVARLVGMKPRALYLGFPPALVKVRRKGIEYGIGAIPLGGYVRIPGMQRPAGSDFRALMSSALHEDPSLAPAAQAVSGGLDHEDYDAARAALPALSTALEQAHVSPSALRSARQAVRDVDEGTGADAYWRQSTWKQVAAIAAGPGMNILVAFVIFFAVYATGAPSQTPSTEVAQVEAKSPAAEAGLRTGDRIVAVNGRRTVTFTQVSKAISGSDGRPITVTVDRGGRTVELGPRRTVEEQGRWVWGFVPASQLVSHPLGESARLAIGDCWRVVTGTVASIGALFHSHQRAEVSGPVGIVRTSAQYLEVGFQWYLMLLGLISMSLALFNLLPLLPLDGGNIVFSIIAGVRGRPVPRKVYQRVSSFGMALILVITVIAFSNDISATPR
ncbi:MAG TPA: M50 family metallopeptidase [Gaiellaceae bacterium]|nr:M50 family metallopeptidase [Gaiellaceae bacterium]